MISLREHVRIHKASLKIVMQRVEYMLGGVDFMATQGLKGRLDDAYQLLEYYEVTATTLLEQQQNLLSLVSCKMYKELTILLTTVGFQPRDCGSRCSSRTIERTGVCFPTFEFCCSEFLACRFSPVKPC
jgi:hypothetical protein